MPRQDDPIKCLGNSKFLKAGFRLLGEKETSFFSSRIHFCCIADFICQSNHKALQWTCHYKKRKGGKNFPIPGIEPGRRGTKLVFKFMKVLRAITPYRMAQCSKSYLVVHWIERRFGSPKVIVKGPLMSPPMPNFRPLNTIKYRQV